MSIAPPARIASPGWGEEPPTAGLPPRWRDLLHPGRGTSLEAAICRRFGFDDIEIVSTGTAGLLIAFTWLKERMPGRDTVIVPGYTCPLVVLAAAAAGSRVIACDTVPGGFDLDAEHLAGIIDARTLCVVPTHYGGALTDVDRVRKAAAAVSPDIAIVEDAAQAFGATQDGRSAGLAGDIGVLSFGVGKGFTIYEGGALVARNADTMAGLRRVAGRLLEGSSPGEIGRGVMLAGYHACYNRLGLRAVYGIAKRRALARDDEIGAAGDRFSPDIPVTRVGSWRKDVGRAALARLESHLHLSRLRMNQLAGRLEQIPGLAVHRPRPGDAPSATFLLVTLREAPQRDEVIRALWRSRLGVARLFARAIGDYPDMAPLLLQSATPHSRALAAGTITISTSATLSRAAEQAIFDTLAGIAS